MKRIISKVLEHKKTILVFLMFVGITGSLFADYTAIQTDADTMLQNVVTFLTSGWVKLVLIIAMIAAGLSSLVVGGQWKKFLVQILIAAAIIFSASTIIGFVLG